ncbi:class I SAM-dependent DNA methyltransferase [Spirobacillus cienkowskii]|uniref:type I restriction-modification system subunit M n=1 Tax=Spirobacillus cienkowskii TaxID=495820 RepID=UPI0030D57FB0
MPKIKKTPKEEKQKIKKTPKEPKENKSTTNLGFEEKLWQTADKLRAHMDAAVYKHVVLGLVFLKYVSDSFIERYNELLKEDDGFEEEKDAYSEKNVFWVPKNARWDNIKNNAKKPEIGKIIDDAMNAIEKENRTLKGVLQKDYARPDLDKRMLGELVDLISSIELGDKTSKQKDLLGRVYEYFLGKFASAEGKLGGQFYTPGCIVKLLVEMIEPLKGRIYDPCCGSGGMFVQSIKFLDAHGGKKGQLSIYGQESNPTTWKLCKMNLAIRGLEGDLGEMNADTFHNDQHRDLKADYILANPPFNISDWGGEMLKDDQRWRYGVPSAGNANYAWLQHMVHRLAPNGVAGIVLANGSLSSNQSSEGEIRKKMLEADIIDCIISLPGQLFYSTQIPASLWFISRNKKTAPNQKNRSGKVLFIDCRKMGIMTSRVNRELTESEIKEVGRLYHAWRGEKECGTYQDKAGFCKSVTLDEIEKNGWVLTPGRYVGAEDVVDDEGSFEEKIINLKNMIFEYFKNSGVLMKQIEKNLKFFG